MMTKFMMKYMVQRMKILAAKESMLFKLINPILIITEEIQSIK